MDGEDNPGPRKHKRGRRKKLQASWKEKHLNDMVRQLERRFPNQPSTSSAPPPVEMIPLPSESVPGQGDGPRRLTERDYEGVDYMKDPPVVSTHSAEIWRSLRVVRWAEDAERIMMAQANTTVDTVIHEFWEKVLEKSLEKRRKQVDVPYVEYPMHRKDILADEVEDVDMTVESNETQKQLSDISDSDTEKVPGAESSESSNEEEVKMEKKDVRKVKRKKTKEERYAEKIRQTNLTRKFLERKRKHPNAIHPDIQFNEKGLANENPECRCPLESRTSGLKHGYYPGEDQPLDCTKEGTQLYAYTLRVIPEPNDKQTRMTEITIDRVDYLFEGFSLVTHSPLPDCMTRMPICKYGIEYQFQLVQESIPNGCFYAEDTVIMQQYLFHEVFEMLDFSLHPKYLPEDVYSCPIIHLMPRYVNFKDGIAYLCSTKTVLAHFLWKGENALFTDSYIQEMCTVPEDVFFSQTSKWKQSILLNAEWKPAGIRADSFERNPAKKEIYFVYNAIRYNAYSNPNMSKLNRLEKKFEEMQARVRDGCAPEPNYDIVKRDIEMLRSQHQSNRHLQHRHRVDGYTDSGVKPDIVAHVVMAILACHHVRFNFALSFFEKNIGYQFNDRKVIELAMIHASLKTSYGTNIDHVKNLIANCGYRRKYGGEEKKEKKKGAINLYSIMTGQANTEPILHNERLEYLGDAVVELIVSHHLFFMLPHHYEGGLATYRTALVQNRNLAHLAQKIGIDGILLYAHGAELCNEAEWKHALANAFEALMAAVYLDGGIAACDEIFSMAMYGDQPELKVKWDHVNEHELKREDPLGDRELSNITPALSNFHKLERMTGIQFNNIRLLAKAFTRRNVPPSELTKGHNQRLEWLGDSVLQLIISDYLFRNFPLHHEGHMSLLRTSLVSNQTQAYVCDDLGFAEFVIKPPHKTGALKMKDKADLVEAFIGALYVDRGIEHCRSFVRIVFCPRLKDFIDNEKWNDAKSHLQQWCLLERDESNPEPTMPEYKTLSAEGPTNSRQYKVGVYFRGRRLATAVSSSVHQAELRAAEHALSGIDMSKIADMRENKRCTLFRDDIDEGEA